LSKSDRIIVTFVASSNGVSINGMPESKTILAAGVSLRILKSRK
jgi:hypothetical protein